MPRRRLVLLAGAVCAAGAGCGTSTNLLGLTAPAGDRHAFEDQLDLAQADYDRGNLPAALDHSRRAYNLDPASERAALLYGFINLSLAGGDPFVLARALIAGANRPATGGGTRALLGSLQPVIGLTPPELAQMGQLDTADPDLPIIIPACAEVARAVVAKLGYANAAIGAVCPFVDPGARVAEDPAQSCAVAAYRSATETSALFLWAFAHLTEAMAFNAVLTYATHDPTGAKSNLELRVEKLAVLGPATPAAGVATLVTALAGLNATLGAVLPAGGICAPGAPTTQLRATLSDLLAVEAAFERMPGLPKGVANAIEQETARIRAAATARAPGAPSGTAGQLAALKGDFTKSIAAKLASKLDKLGADPSQPVTPAQRAQLCAAYAGIAAGSGQASQLCPGGPSPAPSAGASPR